MCVEIMTLSRFVFSYRLAFLSFKLSLVTLYPAQSCISNLNYDYLIPSYLLLQYRIFEHFLIIPKSSYAHNNYHSMALVVHQQWRLAGKAYPAETGTTTCCAAVQ